MVWLTLLLAAMTPGRTALPWLWNGRPLILPWGASSSCKYANLRYMMQFFTGKWCHEVTEFNFLNGHAVECFIHRPYGWYLRVMDPRFPLGIVSKLWCCQNPWVWSKNLLFLPKTAWERKKFNREVGAPPASFNASRTCVNMTDSTTIVIHHY